MFCAIHGMQGNDQPLLWPSCPKILAPKNRDGGVLLSYRNSSRVLMIALDAVLVHPGAYRKLRGLGAFPRGGDCAELRATLEQQELAMSSSSQGAMARHEAKHKAGEGVAEIEAMNAVLRAITHRVSSRAGSLRIWRKGSQRGGA